MCQVQWFMEQLYSNMISYIKSPVAISIVCEIFNLIIYLLDNHHVLMSTNP